MSCPVVGLCPRGHPQRGRVIQGGLCQGACMVCLQAASAFPAPSSDTLQDRSLLPRNCFPSTMQTAGPPAPLLCRQEFCWR